MLCPECGEAELELFEDGPDGHPIWCCDACECFWDDKDGKPEGKPERPGDPPSQIRMFKPWSNTG